MQKECGTIIRYVETNCKSQRQSARDVAFFGRYASCPQLVRCEARNVGPGTLVQGNVAGEVRETPASPTTGQN